MTVCNENHVQGKSGDLQTIQLHHLSTGLCLKLFPGTRSNNIDFNDVQGIVQGYTTFHTNFHALFMFFHALLPQTCSFSIDL